jgi:hypothetical protein
MAAIKKTVFHIMILNILLCFLISSPLHSASIEGVTFVDDYILNGKKATIRGVGLLRYLVVIKAYVGAFYLKENVAPDNALKNVERRLVLHYFHAIKAEDFASATTEMIEKNVSPKRFKALQPQIRQLNALYRDVEPGDRYLATYIPGIGTELTLNNKVLGVVPGAEYSTAFFSIWIGKNPIDKGFRDSLLGK